MALYSFDKDCAEGACGAYIFAGAATETALGVYHGDARCLLVAIFLPYHFDCSVGAVAFAVVAGYAILVGYAVVGYPHGCSYLYCALFFSGDGFYCSIGTHFGTGCAGRATEAALE